MALRRSWFLPFILVAGIIVLCVPLFSIARNDNELPVQKPVLTDASATSPATEEDADQKSISLNRLSSISALESAGSAVKDRLAGFLCPNYTVYDETRIANTLSGSGDLDDELDGDRSSSYSNYKPPHCDDPYLRPGYFYRPEDVIKSAYVPYYDDLFDMPVPEWSDYPTDFNLLFDEKPIDQDLIAQAPTNWVRYIKSYVRARNMEEGEQRSSELKKWGQYVSWLRGKRILMAADSIDRFMALHLCQIVGQQSSFKISTKGRHTTAWCSIPELNMTIYHWHIPSMFNNNPKWWGLDYMDHVPFEERFETIFKPTLDSVIGADGRAPDLIIFQSLLWDIRGWAKSEQYKNHVRGGTYVSRQLYWSELVFYKNRLNKFIRTLKDIFGEDVPMLYRSALSHRSEGINDVPMYELDRMARLVAHHQSVEVMEWGLTVTGYTDIFLDDMHIGLNPHSYLYNNMMLYYLFRASGGTEVRGKITNWPDSRQLSKGDAWDECHRFNSELRNR
ncbi:uncharacterized protein V1516DRAFT_665018 [Lipomyces oligophaga]|uniref:uncharacterized protein n=1 Tax=Lipomyces oligophaga TaxID=45792 RepID=UPI0034CD8AA2